MKKTLLLLLALVSTVALAAFELGKVDAIIYHSKKGTEAAKTLALYLNKVYGKKYTLKAAKAAGSAAGIYVGLPAPGVKNPAGDDREYCVLHVDGNKLFLYGNDKYKCDLFAVSDFLEKYCGVRFLWPGELGTVVEKRNPITISPRTETYVPPFEVRLVSSFHYGWYNLSPKERRDLSTWMNNRKVGASTNIAFQHAFASLIPQKVYAKTHPEYYSLVSPKHWIGTPRPDKPMRRVPPYDNGPWQICTSNKEVRRIIAEKIATNNKGVMRSISPNDGFGFCECDNCLAQDGKDAERRVIGHMRVTNRMYDYAEDIAKQVYKLNPKAKVGMFAYSFYDSVPDQKINFPPNMYLSFCYLVYSMNEKEQLALGERLTGLAATGAKVIGREYWGTHYTLGYPLNHSRKIDRNVKLLHKLKAAGIYGETGTNFAARGVDLYILAKLTWNPTLSRDALLKEFCEAAFGKKAAPVMIEMYNKIEVYVAENFEKSKNVKGKNYKFFPKGYSDNARMFAEIFGPKFTDMCYKYLKRAEKLADTPERKARIAYVRKGIDYAKVQSKCTTSYQNLAAIGLNMSLVQPAATEFTMDKATISKVIKEARAAVTARDLLLNSSTDDCSFSRNRRSDALDLRPWPYMTQYAGHQLYTGTFNYIVNGACEYTGYSWDVKGGKYKYSFLENCDDDDNFMVPYHYDQGASLQLDTKPGEVVTVTQQRKVVTTEPLTRADVRMFIKGSCTPAKFVKVYLNDIELEPYAFDAEKAKDFRNWGEMRFKPVNLKPGKYTLKVVVTNNTKGFFCKGKDMTFYLDELQLRFNKVVK